MNASERRSNLRLSDFPVVFMSFDEPWADENFSALKNVWPDAKRVHGVKGLNACHVAAADEAGSDWFLTVDADTRVLPEARDAIIDARLLVDHFRLDWQSRNSATGLISGNGSLKLWSDHLVRRMRSHEAAGDDEISLDADIGNIEPGRTRLVQMEGCFSVSDPAITPYHGFRAGFRETVFLSWLLEGVVERDGEDSAPARMLRHIIGVWCNLGRQATNGLWMIYGARLGLWACHAWSDWDARATTDYDWFQSLWAKNIRPRIGDGARVCRWTRHAWDELRLEEEVVTLGRRLLDSNTKIDLAELSAEQSDVFVNSSLLSTIRTAENMDSLGTAFWRGRIVEPDASFARDFFDVGLLMGYAPSINNLARLHKLELIDGADRGAARQLYEGAVARGNPHAPFHLAGFLLEERGSRDAEIEALFDLAAERGFAAGEGRA